MEIENPQVLGIGGYKDELKEATPVGKCDICKETLYENDDYIEVATGYIFCDIFCMREHLKEQGYIIKSR